MGLGKDQKDDKVISIRNQDEDGKASIMNKQLQSKDLKDTPSDL